MLPLCVRCGKELNLLGDEVGHFDGDVYCSPCCKIKYISKRRVASFEMPTKTLPEYTAAKGWADPM